MKIVGVTYSGKLCLPICPCIWPPSLPLSLSRICNVMDKFIRGKTREESNIVALVDHLKDKAPKVLDRKRSSYKTKPWASWDDQQREAAALLFLQKGRKACVLKYGVPSCPSRSTLQTWATYF